MSAGRLYAAAGTTIAVFLVAWFASGWVWVIILAAAIGGGPWFACSRLLDRIGELEAEVDKVPALEQALADERDVRRRTEAAFAEFQQSVSDAGGRVVLPLRPVDRPDLRVVPPQPKSDSWLEQVMDEQAALGEGGA